MPPPSTAASTSIPVSNSASTYTTIPISPADVITRSLHNFSATISRLRPWPQLISGQFTRPESFSSALARLRANFQYFRINHSIIVSVCGALSLIGSPFSLILFAFIYALWMLLYFYREDPLVVGGWDLSDRLVLVGLIFVSILWVWVSGGVWSLATGILVGVLGCGIHAVLREADDHLSVDDQESLMGSAAGSSAASYGTTIPSDHANFGFSK